jgi:uncharacterized glyoxalase superfamily protein PhnB
MERVEAESGQAGAVVIANRSAPTAAIVPILVYEDVGKALKFLSRAFGFKERLRAEWGRAISHAQMDIGGDWWTFSQNIRDVDPVDGGATVATER